MYIPENKYPGESAPADLNDLKFIFKLMIAMVIMIGSFFGLIYLICK